MTGRRGSNLIEAFPTKEQREFAQGKIKKMPTAVVFTYWTDFERSDPRVWELIDEKHFIPNPEDPFRWWSFKTNITPDDFAFIWDENRTRNFLRTMWDVYRYRKVGHEPARS